MALDFLLIVLADQIRLMAAATVVVGSVVAAVLQLA